MNNAWPITWLAWSAKLRMETSFMEAEVFEHTVPVWSRQACKNIYKLVFCWFSVNTSFRCCEFLELERMLDNVDEWTRRTFSLIYSCVIIQDYFTQSFILLYC